MRANDYGSKIIKLCITKRAISHCKLSSFWGEISVTFLIDFVLVARLKDNILYDHHDKPNPPKFNVS